MGDTDPVPVDENAPRPTASSSFVTVAPAAAASPTAVVASPPARPTTNPALEDAGVQAQGTIVARHGSRITIGVDGDTTLGVGERAQLMRHLEKRIGSATFTGWLDVARVTVLANDGRSLELSIDEETARVMVNGRKQDQFRAGARVRLERAGDPAAT